ncbi:MAG TPA: exosome complex protein Rrp42 [Candidatus Thermoplasmatota archaeon]|nr:exosome complex protein Rrp42 [Candidatus Thermoplasmatota archaeon]
MSDDVISEIKRDYVRNLAKEGKRVDGRAFDEFRPIKIQTGLIQQAEGSARVQIGNTDVFAGVKMAVGTPYPDSPNDGTLTTSAELIPMASPDFEMGPPSGPAIELARVVDRGIREAKTVDMGALCIKPGEKIWMVYLDFHIVDYDGNLFDACSLAGLAALMTTTVPASKHKIEDQPIGEDFPMPVKRYPIMTTAMKLAPGKLAFDPSLIEDKVGGPRLSVSTDEEGLIRAMQKGLEGGLTRDEVREIIRISKEKGAAIREQLFKTLGHR